MKNDCTVVGVVRLINSLRVSTVTAALSLLSFDWRTERHAGFESIAWVPVRFATDGFPRPAH